MDITPEVNDRSKSKSPKRVNSKVVEINADLDEERNQTGSGLLING